MSKRQHQWMVLGMIGSYGPVVWQRIGALRNYATHHSAWICDLWWLSHGCDEDLQTTTGVPTSRDQHGGQWECVLDAILRLYLWLGLPLEINFTQVNSAGFQEYRNTWESEQQRHPLLLWFSCIPNASCSVTMDAPKLASKLEIDVNSDGLVY